MKTIWEQLRKTTNNWAWQKQYKTTKYPNLVEQEAKSLQDVVQRMNQVDQQAQQLHERTKATTRPGSQ
jgi:hypothetical protein